MTWQAPRDLLLQEAAALDYPCVVLGQGRRRRDLTIFGTVMAWEEFVATATPHHRAAAARHLAALAADRPEPEEAPEAPVAPDEAQSGTAVWPPPGGWIPSSPVPCPGCDRVAWFWAGQGWTCRACHPAPRREEG
jgi:hypothetical protein